MFPTTLCCRNRVFICATAVGPWLNLLSTIAAARCGLGRRIDAQRSPRIGRASVPPEPTAKRRLFFSGATADGSAGRGGLRRQPVKNYAVPNEDNSERTPFQAVASFRRSPIVATHRAPASFAA